MDFLLYFDTENRLEYTFTDSEFHSYPIGTSIIDFLDILDSGIFKEEDFEKKCLENKSLAYNPFVCLYRDSDGKIDFTKMKLELTNNITVFSFIRSLIVLIFDDDSTTFNTPPYNKFTTQQKFYLAIKAQKALPDLTDVDFRSRILCLNENTIKNNVNYSLEDAFKNPEELSVKFCEIYDINDVFSAFYITIIKMAICDTHIKRCGCCGKLFFYKDKSEKYCDRIYINSKTCKELGYINKVKNDELLNIYNTAYKTKHAEKQRKTKGKSSATNEAYKNAIEKWRNEAKLLLTAAKLQYKSTNDLDEKQNIVTKLKNQLEDMNLEVY